jgi:hypothetical protein
MGILFIFLVMIVGVIMIRLAAGSFDGDRIESYIRDRGWKLLDRSWDPLGPGWFGEKDSRIYRVVYRDSFGDIHQAHVKTSMLSGVYLTNDIIIERAQETMVRSHRRNEEPETELKVEPLPCHKEDETNEAPQPEIERLQQRIRELETQLRQKSADDHSTP